jgi:hypothetical protein
MFFSGAPDFIWVKIDEVINELIWGLSFNHKCPVKCRTDSTG